MPKINNRYRKIFHTHRVMDIQSLREQLGNRSPRSIFRDLASEGYSTSYTHSGKYYTLEHIPRFDLDGLWFYQDIGFSKYGTLKNTLIQLVDCAEIGKTHDELKKQLRVRVHNTLLDLVHGTKISRSRIEHIYVYVSTDEHRANQQIQRRRSLATAARKTIELPPELIRIEIFAEVIRNSNIKMGPAAISAQLVSRGVQVSIEDVKNLFTFYDLKKNRI